MFRQLSIQTRIARLLLVALIAAAVAVAVDAAHGGASTRTSPVAIKCSATAAAPKFEGKALDLTGAYKWPSTPAFHWYVRQSGTCVYAMYQAKGIAGIFAGGIQPDLKIAGIWSDVPYTSDVEGHGNMVWKVSTLGGKLALVVMSQTGGAAVDQIVLVKKVTPTG